MTIYYRFWLRVGVNNALFGFLLVVFTFCGTTNAQTANRVTVAMRSGEKVGGMLRGITGNEVVVDIAGQSLKLSVETIKYISFVGELESVPSVKTPVAARPLDQALSAFKDLRTATEIGLLREQYSQKLLDTLPRVNEFVNGVGADWADVRLAMGQATRLYQDALTVWGQDTLHGSSESDWAKAAKWVDHAALLASDSGEETHREKPLESTIMLGASVKGRLGVGDTIMSKELDSSSAGSFNDVFKLVLSSQTNLAINLMGNGACWVHLTLADSRGKKLDGDMGGTSYPSTIGRKVDAGTYFIWAGTFRPNEVCPYTLTVGTKR